MARRKLAPGPVTSRARIAPYTGFPLLRPVSLGPVAASPLQLGLSTNPETTRLKAVLRTRHRPASNLTRRTGHGTIPRYGWSPVPINVSLPQKLISKNSILIYFILFYSTFSPFLASQNDPQQPRRTNKRASNFSAFINVTASELLVAPSILKFSAFINVMLSEFPLTRSASHFSAFITVIAYKLPVAPSSTLNFSAFINVIPAAPAALNLQPAACNHDPNPAKRS